MKSTDTAYGTIFVGRSEGVRFERRLFHATLATDDQKEGMAAFLDKRPPAFRQR